RNGLVSFGGFILNSGKSLLPVSIGRKRKIEFIGDSFVAGLGSEGKTRDCVFNRDNENSYIAFGPVLARRLNADYSIIAVSGIGIIRNFGDTTFTSPKTLPHYFERTCFNEDLKWDFKKWQPDLVVVRLGNNDYWHKPYPVTSEFENAYINFLKQIRKFYPNTSMLVLCEPVRKDPHCDFIKNVVAEFKSKLKDKKIWYKELDVNLDKTKDYGCQEHPNESGHKKIADALEPIVRRAMGWR
ncbi:MAG TPA: SGNH/GDSL hydrolase family protein, partial [Ignavibacteriaceae bacterium]